MIENLAHAYSEVFAPEFFVLLCAGSLVTYEWRLDGTAGPRQLGARFGVLALGWGVGLAIYRVGPSALQSVPSLGPDAAGSIGLGAGILLIWGIWRWRDWGRLVPEFSLLLVAVTVPHLAITRVWAVSSHVTYAAASGGHLTLVDRRFVPFLAVAGGMVFSRPLAGAHTWAQSVGGLVLAGAFVGGLYYRRARGGNRAEPGTPGTEAERL